MRTGPSELMVKSLSGGPPNFCDKVRIPGPSELMVKSLSGGPPNFCDQNPPAGMSQELAKIIGLARRLTVRTFASAPGTSILEAIASRIFFIKSSIAASRVMTRAGRAAGGGGATASSPGGCFCGASADAAGDAPGRT